VQSLILIVHLVINAYLSCIYQNIGCFLWTFSGDACDSFDVYIREN